jgi:hypothetical protein
MAKDLCAIFIQILIIALGGICVGIGTDSIWIGAGVALVGIGVASGGVFWALFDRMIVVQRETIPPR